MQDTKKNVGINTLTKCKLGNILDVRRGTSLSGNFYSETGSKIRLTLGNFNYPSSGFKENTSKSNIYFTGDVKPEFILKKGDIITPLTEQVAGLLGETAVIPEDNLYIQSGDIGLVIPDEDVLDKTFARYLVSSPTVKKQLSAAAQQTKIRHTTPDGIKDCDVWIPSLKYQRLAGKLLDTIDTKINANKKIITELEVLAKTIYDYWFVQFDFPDENGNPYRSSGGEMVYNETFKREIPKGWEIGTLKDFGEIVSGGTPSTKKQDYYTETGIAWLTPNDLSKITDKYILHGERDITDQGLKNSSAKLMPKGTVLLTSRAPIGYLGIAANNVATNQGFKSIVPYEDFGSEFVYYTLSHMVSYLKSLGTGSTFTELSKTMLEEVKVALPNSKTIVERFNSYANKFGAKRYLLERENCELKTLRDFLLPMFLNGQLSIQAQSDSDAVDATQKEVGACD